MMNSTSDKNYKLRPLRVRGFSLMELMIVIAIVGITLALVAPSLSNIIEGNRVTSQTRKLMSSIFTARSEAVKRNTTVSMCKSSNATSCSTDASVGWEDGYLIFVDADTDGVVDAGEEVIKIDNGAGTKVSINPNANFTNFLFFSPTGNVNNIGSFFICPPSGDKSLAEKVAINIVGRPRQASLGSGESC